MPVSPALLAEVAAGVVALYTLVGSNVINPLLGIGLAGAISTYAVPQPVVFWDLPFKLAVGVGLGDLAERERRKIERVLRPQGAVPPRNSLAELAGGRTPAGMSLLWQAVLIRQNRVA